MTPNTDPTYPSGSVPNYPQSSMPNYPQSSMPNYPPPPGTPGGPPPYGYQYPQYSQAPGYYAAPMAPTTNGLAIASLACSIGNFIIVPVIGSILAIIFGTIALGQIKASNGRQQGRGLAIAGIVIGAVGLVLLVFFIIGIVALASDPNFQQSIPQN